LVFIVPKLIIRRFRIKHLLKNAVKGISSNGKINQRIAKKPRGSSAVSLHCWRSAPNESRRLPAPGIGAAGWCGFWIS
jgi:hypothetical protein